MPTFDGNESLAIQLGANSHSAANDVTDFANTTLIRMPHILHHRRQHHQKEQRRMRRDQCIPAILSLERKTTAIPNKIPATEEITHNLPAGER